MQFSVLKLEETITPPRYTGLCSAYWKNEAYSIYVMKILANVKHGVAGLVGAGAILLSTSAQASFIELGNSQYFQDFNSPSLPRTGESKQLPQGWSFATLGRSSNHAIRADDGDRTAGGIYSYGEDHSRNRALGTLAGADGSFGVFGADFENASSAAINQLNISFTGEEWRLARAGIRNSLQFQYSLDAHSLTTGDWLNVPQLDFFTPNLQGAGQHDGTLSANQQQLSGTISFLNIPRGGTFWVRWIEEPNGTSSGGDGLAIDNFSVSAVPEISTLLGGVAACVFFTGALIRQRSSW